MSRSAGSTRRDFLRNAAAATAATAASVALPGVAQASAAARAEPIEPLKVGVFGLDFTFWGIWADLMSPEGQYVGTSALRMRPTHVWDKDTRKAEQFARRWGAEVVDRYDGMLGKVDAVANGDLNNTPWQHLLMRPYLEAGVPCFLMRHWASTIGHLDEMFDLATRNNAALMATLPFEHFPAVGELTARMRSIGQIQAAFGTSSVADEPHFHLPYMALKVLGHDVEWVSMASDDVRRVGYLNINYGYARAEGQRPFVASLHSGAPDVFSLTVVGENGTASASMHSSANYYTRFFDQLVDMQKFFEKREHYEPLDVIRKKYLALQAAYYSSVERGGAPVQVGSVPVDWVLPAWQPTWYDGSEFR